ncbi:MAG: galactitol-1-phosphate 5-dehydrogenase [Lachnospiraceae bacterium]|nr:galactitol-1-phosphate 5-dehydrogenase [Lachnospiraceae bacterium]
MKKIIDEYPKEMRALVLHDVADLRLETVPVPELAAGSVLLKIQACGICSSDKERVFVTGTYHFPTIPGHEFAGKIVAAADDVDEALLGRRASVFPMLPCKECDACKIEQYAQCSNYNYFGSRCDGGFAEYLVVPVWNLVLYDDSVPYAMAALSEPSAVSMHAVNIGNIKKGEKVAVVGTGTIGFLVAAFAKDLTDQVVICGRSENKLAYARKLGFETINLTSDSYKNVMKSLVGEGGFDVVFEAVGSNTTIEQSVDLAGNFGRIVLLGNPKKDLKMEKNVYWSILRKQKQIMGSWNSSYGSEVNDWAVVADWMKKGSFDFGQLITHRFTMDEYEKAFDLIRKEKEKEFMLKVMIMIGDEE